MGVARRRSPGSMPSSAAAKQVADRLELPFVLAGCRGTSRSRDPQPGTHDDYRISAGELGALKGRFVVVFIHGYNVSTRDAVKSTSDFFQRAEAAQKRLGGSLADFGLLGFTWPGDTGPPYFNAAQEFAQYSGVALYKLVNDLFAAGVTGVAAVSHSLGAHVLLRSAAILGERRFHVDPNGPGYSGALLLAPAVEHDVFERPARDDEYHFPEAAFGIEQLHIVTSRSDDVLKYLFRLNEWDRALGFAGPRSMSPLKSLARRVSQVLPGKQFRFEQHDFSPRSSTILNPNLWVHSHGDYWKHEAQADYYVNFLR